MSDPVWNRIETRLREILSLPHNVVALAHRTPASTPEAEVRKQLSELRSGLVGTPQEEEFRGQKLFLRLAGPKNQVYAGAWWFDADIYGHVEAAYSRIYFQAADRKAALRDILRELLAVSQEWNPMTEVWALELPAGEQLVGFTGIGSPQRLFAQLPLTAKGNRLLAGGVRQIYFPVKNPLWVRQYRFLN